MSKKKTYEEVMTEFKDVHGDRYDYSLVKGFMESNEYSGIRTKLPIICREHGLFWQSHHHHAYRGHGCPKCTKNGVKYTLEEYKEKVKNIFGDDIVVLSNEYKNAHTKMKFLCKKHGEFETKPYILLQGHTCPKCGKINAAEHTKNDEEEILDRFRLVHGDTYDYSNFKYIDYNTPSEIICHKIGCNGKEHGSFWQRPHNHISGQGCPICNRSQLEKEIATFLDKENIEYEEQKKFPWMGVMKVDFYLPDYDLVIECQGKQHYIPSNFGSKKKSPEEMFDCIKDSDTRKKKLCEEHGLKIVYYTHENETDDAINTFKNKEDLKRFLNSNARIK